jgi:tetratricopeptide (TPR) repeat protein
VLLDNDDVVIEHTMLASRPRTVVVGFDPILWSLQARPFAVDFLLKCGADTIAVRKKHEHFYQPLTRADFDAAVAPALARYERRLAYGSSLGAYAVLYYCRDGYDHAVSSSPRVSVHPRHGVAHWQRKQRFRHEMFDPARPATSRATVFYDPMDDQDRRFVEAEIRRGWPQAEYVPVRYAGHPANQFLAEIGFIAPYVRALVQDRPLPPLDRRLKARSGMYHQVLAEACLRRGKLEPALVLAHKALKLSPKLDLARRTLGEIETARGAFDVAEAHLRDYAQRVPHDGSTAHLLEQLATRRAEDTSRRAAAVAASASRALRQAREAEAAAAAEAAALQRAQSPWHRGLRRARQWLTTSDEGHPTLAQRLHHHWRGTWPARGTVTRDDVVWAYRQFLGRAPESEQALAAHLQARSQRALVQAFVESPEYLRRQQQASAAATATGSAVRRGAYRRDGPVVVVVGNCQAPGVATVLAASCGVAEVHPVTGLNLSADVLRQRLLAHAARAEVWFASPSNAVAREVFAEKAQPGARMVTVPALHFNAFHPDVCYAQHRTLKQLTTQHYNSAIVAWSYANGLAPARAAALFSGDTYRALGYLDAWPGAVEALRHSFDASDLKPHFNAFMQHVQRLGCFMHTPNHPSLAVVALLARMAARQAGLELLDEPAPGELVDGLASTLWPVYPEIASELGLECGSHTWKFVSRNEYLHGVPAYVQHTYRAYAAQGIAPADLEIRWLRTEQLDRVLRPRAGL